MLNDEMLQKLKDFLKEVTIIEVGPAFQATIVLKGGTEFTGAGWDKDEALGHALEFATVHMARMARMREEHGTLEQRITSLRSFIGSKNYEPLPHREKVYQKEQLNHMENYAWVLHKRITLTKTPA